MEWKPEDVRKGEAKFGEVCLRLDGQPRNAIEAVMTLAVELAGARGGTLTAEQFARLLPSEKVRAFAAQCATVATLQARVEQVRARVCEDEDKGDIFAALDRWERLYAEASQRATMLQAKVAELENGAASYRGVIASLRNEVGRVEQERDALRTEVARLEAQVERLQIDISGHVNTIREQHDTITALQEKVERLTAAGQVLSEHVDAKAGEPLGDAP
jgi:chromosome segregation ATPase